MASAQRRLCGVQSHLDPTAAGLSRSHVAGGGAAPSGSIPKRPLFSGGPSVSCIGLGAWPLAGAHGPVGQSEGIDAVKAAVGDDVAMSFIDTAEAYELEGHGGSETVIGLALSAEPELREQAFVTTKVSRGPYTAENIRASAERSLSRLQLDQLELLQLHHFRAGDGDDGAPTIEEQMSGLKALQDDGKIKYIGLNNANAVQLQMAWDTGVRFHTVQVRYHMFARYIEDDVIPWCREHGVGILAHSVLGKGLCTGKHSADHIFPDDDERSSRGYSNDFSGERWHAFCAATDKLKVIAARRGYSCAELAVGWVLRNPEISVALVGAKNTEQVLLNARYMQDFTEEELAEIETILDAAPEVGFQGETSAETLAKLEG